MIMNELTDWSKPGARFTHHKQALSCDVAWLRRYQKSGSIGNILDLAQPGNSHFVHCLLFPTFPEIATELGLDEARADAIDSDVFVEELSGQKLSQGN